MADVQTSRFARSAPRGAVSVQDHTDIPHATFDEVVSRTAGLPGTATLVLLLMHRHARRGKASLSLPRIASLLNVNYATAASAIRRLIEGAHIARVAGGADGLTSVYRIAAPVASEQQTATGANRGR